MTMQNLNARLASYLDKVRFLEEENAQLECKIRKHYDRQAPLGESKDYSSYCQQIEDLKKQLISATVDNRKLGLDIHNNQLTADDFKMKCETELIFRQDVEADIKSLRQVLDQLILRRSDLETQIESLQEERCCLKKSHAEEVKLLKNKTTGNFNVEVNSNPGSDLQKVLDDLRRQYEAIIERNRREAEKWYESKMEEINQQAINRSKDAEDDNNQVLDLKRQLRTLEINLQAQLSLRDTLQDSLAETQRHYNNYLVEIQNQISSIEQQLAELRAETECQNRDYRKLLDAKCLLEQEIKTYHSLLEGEQLDPKQTEEEEVKSPTLT
ncbi:keratin, type I cytoskeletal 15-like [Sceloporus undulatus]|uniref:keratin, type I cytoskeletal 15-like n=1 Tax=Sceloporus undulatus TaxID=8520 RepID=UPI001C4D1718|nr:keratin, type I cytoskeletal 15-like [Sceloporus undulatus]